MNLETLKKASVAPGPYGDGYGITLRQHFAGLAMQGLLSNLGAIRKEGFKDHEIEMFAVMRADALLAELSKESP